MTFDARARAASRPRRTTSPWRSRKENVSARSSSSTHERCRNSTSGTSGSSSGAAAFSSSIASVDFLNRGGYWSSTPRSLPALLERRERLAELGERPLAVGLLVAGHPVARLRVEDEALRRPLGPLRGGLGRGQVVERRVDLDGVEALGVVGESRRGRGDALRIPALDQAVVGPRAGPDPIGADARRHGRDHRREADDARCDVSAGEPVGGVAE